MVEEGTGFDQATFLIALLRAAEIPARYVSGTVDIGLPALERLYGLDNRQAVESYLGWPPDYEDTWDEMSPVWSFNPVWVAAYLPYDNYRGLTGDDSGKK